MLHYYTNEIMNHVNAVTQSFFLSSDNALDFIGFLSYDDGMIPRSVFYALVALVLIGISDSINKRARQVHIPIRSYLLLEAPFFTCTILIVALLQTGIRISCVDIIYSLIGAVFSFAAFTMMLHSLTYGYAHINYAVFRLSFVFSSTSALIFLHEKIGFSKVLGLIFAFLAIVLFFNVPDRQKTLKTALIIAVCAMLINSAYQIFLKLATRVYSNTASFLFLMSIFFGVMVVIYNLVKGKIVIPKATFLYAPIHGIMMALGALFYINAVALGEVSTIVPIVQLSFLVTLIISATLLREKVNIQRLVGIVLAVLAIVVLGWL